MNVWRKSRGNRFWFELARGSSWRGFELSGVDCIYIQSLGRLWFSLGIESHPAVSAKERATKNWDVTVYLPILKWRPSHRIGLVYKDNFVSSLNWTTVEVLVKDTVVSGQVYLRSPSEIPVSLNSQTNSVFLHSRKRPAPSYGHFFESRGCPLVIVNCDLLNHGALKNWLKRVRAFQIELEFGSWFLRRGDYRSTRRKTSRNKWENQQ